MTLQLNALVGERMQIATDASRLFLKTSLHLTNETQTQTQFELKFNMKYAGHCFMQHLEAPYNSRQQARSSIYMCHVTACWVGIVAHSQDNALYIRPTTCRNMFPSKVPLP